MTEPVVQLDPITGLPIDLQPPTYQQIPLNSQPIIAPQWNPLGRVTSTLHPDNIPTVFGTMQAQNPDNPTTVNALRTHTGTQALEVYDLNSGGGGGGSTLVKSLYNSGSTSADMSGSGTAFSSTFAILLDNTATAIVGLEVQYFVTATTATGTTASVLTATLETNGREVYVPVASAVVAVGTAVAGDGRYEYLLTFTPAIDIATTFQGFLPIHLRVSSSYATWAGRYTIRTVT